MHITEQPYTATEIMNAFHDAPYALWLDSADQNHPESLWSFVMWDPSEIIIYKEGMITHNGAHFVHDAPFDFLRERLEAFDKNAALAASRRRGVEDNAKEATTVARRKSGVLKNNIPFTGGAAGYFGYDLGRTLEKLPQDTKPSNAPDMVIGIYTDVYAYDHQKQC